MTIQLFDSATRSVRPFIPLHAGEVRIYDCGPTVYSYQHIGNLYRYVVADVVRRTFELFGYRVTQVMNITDAGHLVDDADTGEDKMELAARSEGQDPNAIAQRYTDRFMEDRRKLNILDPHVMPYATRHIPEMVALIEKLVATGHAYVATDGVYFDVTSFSGYGTRLSPEAPDERRAGARVEVNENKRHPFDFALWRAAKPGDLQQWDSPWGRGNPGWHIECSAMSMRYLGETFDLHSGGEDHLFPHHECEIAQSEAATGKPFVRYWSHVYFLKVDGGGMHKSIGNVYLVSDIEGRGFDPLAFRLLVLGVGYRKGLDFTWSSLAEAQKRLERWRASIRTAWEATGGAPAGIDPGDPIMAAFRAALGDDFNTPKALAQSEAALGLANSTDLPTRSRALGLLFAMDQVLGLGLEASAQSSDTLGDTDRALFDERAAARAAGDYARSDELRIALEARGIKVKDSKDGTRWERVGTPREIGA
ncbi:MAG: cysteine--tRNA ligase [Candidatus Limnocylindrales bacterium]